MAGEERGIPAVGTPADEVPEAPEKKAVGLKEFFEKIPPGQQVLVENAVEEGPIATSILHSGNRHRSALRYGRQVRWHKELSQSQKLGKYLHRSASAGSCEVSLPQLREKYKTLFPAC
jgi:hypothetical protein